MPVLPSYKKQLLICSANQLAGFYVKATLVLNGLNKKLIIKYETPSFVNGFAWGIY